jgi:hypothetical protein
LFRLQVFARHEAHRGRTAQRTTVILEALEQVALALAFRIGND